MNPCIRMIECTLPARTMVRIFKPLIELQILEKYPLYVCLQLLSFEFRERRKMNTFDFLKNKLIIQNQVRQLNSGIN